MPISFNYNNASGNAFKESVKTSINKSFTSKFFSGVNSLVEKLDSAIMKIGTSILGDSFEKDFKGMSTFFDSDIKKSFTEDVVTDKAVETAEKATRSFLDFLMESAGVRPKYENESRRFEEASEFEFDAGKFFGIEGLKAKLSEFDIRVNLDKISEEQAAEEAAEEAADEAEKDGIKVPLPAGHALNISGSASLNAVLGKCKLSSKGEIGGKSKQELEIDDTGEGGSGLYFKIPILSSLFKGA